MNIAIGNNRWVKFTRDATGEWRGQGYGYRFRVTRSNDRNPQWLCRVYGLGLAKRLCVASYQSHKMKSAIQESARLADIEVARLAVELERQLGSN